MGSLKTISCASVGTGFTVALMYEFDNLLAEEGKVNLDILFQLLKINKTKI